MIRSKKITQMHDDPLTTERNHEVENVKTPKNNTSRNDECDNN